MICPICGGAELVHGIHQESYTYQSRTTIFDLEGDKCPACGELILTEAECRKMDTLMENFEQMPQPAQKA